MICKLHPSNGEVEVIKETDHYLCPSCEAGSPPDIGIEIYDKTKTDEHIS